VNNRLTPTALFSQAVAQIAEANQGDVDSVVAKLRDDKTPPSTAPQTPAPALSPLDAATLQLQAAVDQLNGQWGVQKRSLAEWYQDLTGRTLGATTPATFKPEEVSAALEAARPALQQMSAAVGQLAALGNKRTPTWDADVKTNYEAYLSARNAIIEKLGPLDAARRAGQLDASSGAQLGAFVTEFGGLRQGVQQMGMIY
jgi:hypothetical protein